MSVINNTSPSQTQSIDHTVGQAHSLSQSQFVLETLNEEFVKKEIHGMTNGKATGLDGISVRLLKSASPVICSHLTRFYNLSLRTGKIPLEWKKSRVTVIFKGGDKEQMNNYRPISVIPVIKKVLERVVHNQLHEFLVTNNLLAVQQSGFRKAHLTNTVLCYVTDFLYIRWIRVV